MGDATIVASALRYPGPDGCATLAEAVRSIEHEPARREMECFVHAIEELSLAEWEELHTATLDLSPLFVPYVGHAVWGENYRRGAFMADLMRAQAEVGIGLHGELPDHLEPILRYLDAAPAPLADLIEVLPTALMKMDKELRTADRKSPYRRVLAAIRAVVDERIAAMRRTNA